MKIKPIFTIESGVPVAVVAADIEEMSSHCKNERKRKRRGSRRERSGLISDQFCSIVQRSAQRSVATEKFHISIFL